jgi:hypothetical protein
MGDIHEKKIQEQEQRRRKLTVNEILSANLREKELWIKEWDGVVIVREFSKGVQQRMRKEAEVKGEINTEKLEMLMFVYGVVEPKFTKEHYDQLKGKSATAIDKVINEVMAMSGMKDDIKKAEKNFRP